MNYEFFKEIKIKRYVAPTGVFYLVVDNVCLAFVKDDFKSPDGFHSYVELLMDKRIGVDIRHNGDYKNGLRQVLIRHVEENGHFVFGRFKTENYIRIQELPNVMDSCFFCDNVNNRLNVYISNNEDVINRVCDIYGGYEAVIKEFEKNIEELKVLAKSDKKINRSIAIRAKLLENIKKTQEKYK